MVRWIIILIVLFLLYRFARRYRSLKRPAAKKPPDQIQDEMVQDPVCGTYVPKRMALTATRPGEVQAYFCSPACREKFLTQGAGPEDRAGAQSRKRA